MGNLGTYVFTMAVAFAGVMTIWGVLRWLGNDQKRSGRQKKIYIASAVFIGSIVIIFIWNTQKDLLQNEQNWVSSVQAILKLFGVGIVIVFLALFAIICVMLIVYGLMIVIQIVTGFKTKESAEELKTKIDEWSKKMQSLIETPLFIASLTAAIIAVFIILPFVIGDNRSSYTECWVDGVRQIASAVIADPSLSVAISTYALIFISILGIGYVTSNILYEIIKKRFEKTTIFLCEYSNAIGLLAVGVSILCTILFKNELDDLELSKVLEFAKPLVIVLFAIALGVITLEIVRLLIDMRERLIRQEARYLFALLVGWCIVILIKVFYVAYNSINVVLGENSRQIEAAEEKIEAIHESIMVKTAQNIYKEINGDGTDNTRIYKAFKGIITKK